MNLDPTIRITLMWMSAHIGIEQNDKADQLAKQAVGKRNVTQVLPDNMGIAIGA